MLAHRGIAHGARRAFGSCMAAALVLGCSAGDRRVSRDDPAAPVDAGGRSTLDASPSMDARFPMWDAGPPLDPFDPDTACGSAAVPSERVPGSLLLVFDKSTSMDEAPGGGSGGTSKWELAESAISAVLSSVSDDLEVGLMLFPYDEPACDVRVEPGVPQVPVAPLSSSRTLIQNELTHGPDGSQTPILAALRAGYDYLGTLSTAGQRGIVLVTDGAENCDGDEDALLEQARQEHESRGWLTFAIGLTQSNRFLSMLAHHGGTPRNDTCLPECTTDLCMSDTDCPGSAPCVFPFGLTGVPGFCGCNADSDCPAPLTCESVPLLGRQCQGAPNCCHYDASEGSFQMDFEAALSDIARRFLESCVFDLPRDDGAFDPALVNVGVTFEGEERTVLPQSDDATSDSWNFTTPEYESVVIQGDVCDRLLMEAATVEIVLGCPTIVI